MPEKVQPDSPHARSVQLGNTVLGQVRGRAVVVHDDHPAQPLRLPGQGSEQVAVVGAQEAGLDQHAPLQAVLVEPGQVLLQGRGVGRDIAGITDRGQPGLENMGVSVDGMRREIGHDRILATNLKPIKD